MATKKQTASRKKKSKKRDLKRSLLIYSALLLFGIASTLGLFIYSVYAGLWGKLPSYRDLQNIRHAEASTLCTEEGVLIGKYYIENRTNINFKNIPPDAIHALLATEDVRFYQHEGVDRISMLRVLFKTFLLGKRSAGGGSTLSQQLAKNLYPRDEQQVTFMPVVKLKEMFTARRLENIYNKEEILTLYLNTVSFGENAFGLESAAQKYFSATASELTLPQAATLIGMLKGPSYYNPRLHPDRAIRRRNTVINQMVKYDFLPEAEGEKHKACELGLRYNPTTHYSGLAPYLRERIRQDALRIIEAYNAEYGTKYNLYTDGMLLTTTLDAEMQQYAEDAAKTHIARIQESYTAHLNGHEPWDKHPDILQNAIRNSRIYKSLKNKGRSEEEILAEMNRKKPMLIYHPDHREERVEYSSIDSIKHYLKIFQPALIAVEPQTGKVKAWVGGADYKYFQYDQVTAPRQVGSVFKPVVYAAALRHGARLDTYYSNEQRSYPEYNNWTPRNSDNRYDGYYTFKGALSKSINTIAVEILMQTGIDTVTAYARRLGITADLPPYPSMALGVADIPLQEMVNPFMAFANNGILVPQYYLAEIRDRHGKIIYRTETGIRREAMPAEEAHIMSNILTAPATGSTTKSPARPAPPSTTSMAGSSDTPPASSSAYASAPTTPTSTSTPSASGKAPPWHSPSTANSCNSASPAPPTPTGTTSPSPCPSPPPTSTWKCPLSKNTSTSATKLPVPNWHPPPAIPSTRKNCKPPNAKASSNACSSGKTNDLLSGKIYIKRHKYLVVLKTFLIIAKLTI